MKKMNVAFLSVVALLAVGCGRTTVKVRNMSGQDLTAVYLRDNSSNGSGGSSLNFGNLKNNDTSGEQQWQNTGSLSALVMANEIQGAYQGMAYNPYSFSPYYSPYNTMNSGTVVSLTQGETNIIEVRRSPNNQSYMVLQSIETKN